MDPSSTFPGPVNGSVLYEQEKHVSSAVWESQERGALRCHEHTSKLDQWMLTAKQVELVEKAGFGYLRLIPAISLDNPLISALVERWRRETNTFHLTVGEMTVTLADVALILGLKIDGEAVIGETCTSCISVCANFLGKVPDPGYASGGMLKLSWLKENFSRCPEDAPSEEIECHTRAYILYLIGSTIFSTTTGNKVPVMYLPLFSDFDNAGKYAWGAAALAFLYRALGNACLRTQSTISGCLTLLQCWSYYHLNVAQPKFIQEADPDRFPFVLRWKGKLSGRTTKRDVAFYRELLDLLKPCDVEWLPYRSMDSTVIPEDINNSLIVGRSKTMLICFDKAERHLPDRCLRQYGMLQSIPEDVQRWERKSRGVDGGVHLSAKMETELFEWQNRQNCIVEGGDSIDESEYMQWYLDITRKFIGRPISLSSEFQKWVTSRPKRNKSSASLRDIAALADTFPTDGLDPQQIESITRIRYIAHDCLSGQVGSPVILSASPQIELGKRLRGKEKVRRKNTTKREKKSEPADSEDDQSQFFGVAAEIDELQLHHTGSQVDQPDLCLEDDNVNHLQLCHSAGEGDNVQVQICNEDTGVGHSQLCHADYEAHNALVQGDSKGYYPQFDNANMLHADREIEYSHLCHTAGEGANTMVDEQLRDVSDEIDASHLPIVTNEDNSHLCDMITKDNDSQLDGSTTEFDSQINNETDKTLLVAVNVIP